MKKGETPELSAKWWKTSQPKGLSTGGRLEMALKAFEAASAGLGKDPTAEHLKTALDTLDQVKDAVQKTIAEAEKARKDAEMEFTVQALKKLDFARTARTLEAEIKDSDEDDDSSLADPVAYAKMLRKALNKLDDEPWNWGFLAGLKPIEHRFLLHRSKLGRALATAAAKDLARPPKLSFGTTIRSPDDPAAIILTVEGPMLAGLATRMKKMLAKMKPQTVSEVLLMVDGQIVPETIDPADVDQDDDQAAAAPEDPRLDKIRQAHRAIAAPLQQAARTSVGTSQAIADHERALEAALAGNDFDAARTHLFELVALSKRTVATDDGVRTGVVEFGKLRIEWVDAKAKVAAALDDLRTSIEDDEDDEDAAIFAQALGKLDSVLARFNQGLTKALDDLATAPAIARPPLLLQAAAISDDYIDYLANSPLVGHVDANPYGVPVAAATALTEPLRRLKAQLATP